MKYEFISQTALALGITTEAITIDIILGVRAIPVLFAKSRFQPEIERCLTRIEAEEPIVTRCKSRHFN